MGAVVAKTIDEVAKENKAREALTSCMQVLVQLDQEDARRVLRSLLVWFEDEDERTALAEGIIESLGEIGRALQGA